MKKALFTPRHLMVVCFVSVLFFSSCKKNDETANWASKVAGTYTGNCLHQLSGTNMTATTIISRINDKTINLQLSYSGGNHCLDSVILNSENTFTINEFDACFTFKETGGGNFNGANISYTLSYDPPYQLVVTGTK